MSPSLGGMDIPVDKYPTYPDIAVTLRLSVFFVAVKYITCLLKTDGGVVAMVTLPTLLV